MHVHYFSERFGDELNGEFQRLLLSEKDFMSIAGDIFLFSTASFYQREKEIRLAHILRSKPTLDSEDTSMIDQRIAVSKSITPVNTGDIDLAYADEQSERLNQIALSFLVTNASKIDYISGLKRAKKLGFSLPVENDVLMFGSPLRISI